MILGHKGWQAREGWHPTEPFKTKMNNPKEFEGSRVEHDCSSTQGLTEQMLRWLCHLVSVITSFTSSIPNVSTHFLWPNEYTWARTPTGNNGWGHHGSQFPWAQRIPRICRKWEMTLGDEVATGSCGEWVAVTSEYMVYQACIACYGTKTSRSL
jgi:hypothetical protein